MRDSPAALSPDVHLCRAAVPLRAIESVAVPDRRSRTVAILRAGECGVHDTKALGGRGARPRIRVHIRRPVLHGRTSRTAHFRYRSRQFLPVASVFRSRRVPCGVRAGDRVHACGFVVYTHTDSCMWYDSHTVHTQLSQDSYEDFTRMIKKRSRREHSIHRAGWSRAHPVAYQGCPAPCTRTRMT